MDAKKQFKIFVLILLWYITSIAAGLYNKEFLDIYPLPIVLTVCQSLMGVICGLIFLVSWSGVQYFRTSYELGILFLLGLVHCVGTVLTNVSTLKSAASFTHTIKA